MEKLGAVVDIVKGRSERWHYLENVVSLMRLSIIFSHGGMVLKTLLDSIDGCRFIMLHGRC